MAHDVYCPICTKRISMWEHTNGKTTPPVNSVIYHKSCLMDVTVEDIASGKYKPQKSP